MKLFRFEKSGAVGLGMVNQQGKNIDISASGMDLTEHFFETNGKKVIGLLDKSDIPMKGNDIHDPHAFITLNDDGKCLIEPANDDSKLLLNGKQLTKNKAKAKQQPIDFWFYTRICNDKKRDLQNDNQNKKKTK